MGRGWIVFGWRQRREGTVPTGWGGGGSGGGGRDLPEMSFDVPFAERTEDSHEAMGINGEEMVETVAEMALVKEEAEDAIAERGEYRLRALDLSSIHMAARVR